MKKIKLKIGDVFTMPISEEKAGFGQVVKIPVSSGVFIMAVFKKIYFIQNSPSLDEIIDDEVLFLGYTMDALLYHKYWHVIGNISSNLDKIKLPYYKLGTPPDMQIVNYKGDRIRKAKKDEFDKLEYETSFAPIEYVLALKAYYKLEEWENGFDGLLYEKTLESIEIVEGKDKSFIQMVKKYF